MSLIFPALSFSLHYFTECCLHNFAIPTIGHHAVSHVFLSDIGVGGRETEIECELFTTLPELECLRVGVAFGEHGTEVLHVHL